MKATLFSVSQIVFVRIDLKTKRARRHFCQRRRARFVSSVNLKSKI
jgi:hypothetical protein